MFRGQRIIGLPPAAAAMPVPPPAAPVPTAAPVMGVTPAKAAPMGRTMPAVTPPVAMTPPTDVRRACVSLRDLGHSSELIDGRGVRGSRYGKGQRSTSEQCQSKQGLSHLRFPFFYCLSPTHSSPGQSRRFTKIAPDPEILRAAKQMAPDGRRWRLSGALSASGLLFYSAAAAATGPAPRTSSSTSASK